MQVLLSCSILDVRARGFALFARQQRFHERLGLDRLFMVTAKSQRIDGEVACDRRTQVPTCPRRGSYAVALRQIRRNASCATSSATVLDPTMVSASP